MAIMKSVAPLGWLLGLLCREHTLALGPAIGVVKHAGEPRQHIADLRFVDDQRWAEREGVADGAAEHAVMILGDASGQSADAQRRIEGLFRCLVAHQLNT